MITYNGTEYPDAIYNLGERDDLLIYGHSGDDTI